MSTRTLQTRSSGRGTARACAAAVGLAVALGGALTTAPARAGDDGGRNDRTTDLRVATFNASLNRGAAGQLVSDLSTRDNAQANAVAEVIQRTRPDVLLINEFDYVPDNVAIDLFRDNYLEVGQTGARPIEYRYAYVAPSNTGVPSGFDLNNDGSVGGENDAFGFGFYEGQFGMAVLSRYPIDVDSVRTFQNFLWKDMPGALLPDDPATPAPADWYSPEELDVFRLSSKSHWDLPISVGRSTVHLLASHPTPPVFDGDEDRNGTRNYDEIRLWADYISSPRQGSYIYDDNGRHGGLRPGSSFVIVGDQNSDPLDGDSVEGAIQQLIDHRRLTDTKPTSRGAVEATELQGGLNATHESEPRYDTADFSDTTPGNLRADYVLPSRDLKVHDAHVFWPLQASPLFRLTGVFPFPTSDHRLVWVDLTVHGHR